MAAQLHWEFVMVNTFLKNEGRLAVEPENDLLLLFIENQMVVFRNDTVMYWWVDLCLVILGDKVWKVYNLSFLVFFWGKIKKARQFDLGIEVS